MWRVVRGSWFLVCGAWYVVPRTLNLELCAGVEPRGPIEQALARVRAHHGIGALSKGWQYDLDPIAGVF